MFKKFKRMFKIKQRVGNNLYSTNWETVEIVDADIDKAEKIVKKIHKRNIRKRDYYRIKHTTTAYHRAIFIYGIFYNDNLIKRIDLN